MKQLISKLDTCHSLYTLFEDLLDSYVADYYVENHWNKLPKSWQNCFSNISMKQLSELLDFSNPIKSKLYPLSLLSLRSIIVHNVLSRKQLYNIPLKDFKNDKVKNLFWKNVKLKKRHEISVLADLCYQSALETDCFCIVDIGSGVGHLSRLLAYKYGFKVCTFEVNSALLVSAEQLDNTFQQALKKLNIVNKSFIKPVHLNKKITSDINVQTFTSYIRMALKEDSKFKFGIVGLHPCGDLSTTLLNLFNKCSQAVFINMASCCYMKLTLNQSPKMGFPLSQYCQRNYWTLSYLSCEIACHAIEKYVIKLKSGDFMQLKIHAYRAAFEKLLICHDAHLKHSGVVSIKCSDDLTFKEYYLKNIGKFNFSVTDSTITACGQLVNNTWHNVVVFYSLRLLLAPVIENIILFDRMLFLHENKHFYEIIPAFDCYLSPRNYVIVSRKNKNIKNYVFFNKFTMVNSEKLYV